MLISPPVPVTTPPPAHGSSAPELWVSRHVLVCITASPAHGEGSSQWLICPGDQDSHRSLNSRPPSLLQPRSLWAQFGAACGIRRCRISCPWRPKKRKGRERLGCGRASWPLRFPFPVLPTISELCHPASSRVVWRQGDKPSDLGVRHLLPFLQDRTVLGENQRAQHPLKACAWLCEVLGDRSPGLGAVNRAEGWVHVFPSTLISSPGNGYVSARASPGLLPVANGNSLNKVIPAKSPPPPTHSAQLGAPSRKPDLRVITSQGGKGLMHHLVSGCWEKGQRWGMGGWRGRREPAPAGGMKVNQQLGLPKRAWKHGFS